MSNEVISSASRTPTPAALRQSWRELPVRSSMLVTLGVLVVIFAVSARGIAQGLSDRRLAREGVAVEATIDAIDGKSRNVSRSVSIETTLSYLLPGETERREIRKAMLSPVQGAVVNQHDKLTIWVDPKDPRKWTDRVPASWLTTLAVPLLLTPIAFVLAILTAIKRRQFIRLWQTGAERSANVVDTHKSALLPGGKVVKVSLVGGDGRIFTTTHPDSLGVLARGERVEAIIDDATKPKKVILQRSYGGTTDRSPMNQSEPVSQ